MTDHLPAARPRPRIARPTGRIRELVYFYVDDEWLELVDLPGAYVAPLAGDDVFDPPDGYVATGPAVALLELSEAERYDRRAGRLGAHILRRAKEQGLAGAEYADTDRGRAARQLIDADQATR